MNSEWIGKKNHIHLSYRLQVQHRAKRSLAKLGKDNTSFFRQSKLQLPSIPAKSLFKLMPNEKKLYENLNSPESVPCPSSHYLIGTQTVNLSFFTVEDLISKNLFIDRGEIALQNTCALKMFL